MLCPHCGAEAGAAVCSECGRPLPRFYADRPRDLAFAGQDDTWQADSGFNRGAVQRSLRKVASDLSEGHLDPDAYFSRVGEMAAFLDSLLLEQGEQLERARAGLSRVPEERDRFAAFEEVAVESLDLAGQAFGAALGELHAFGEDGDGEHVERAAEAGGEAMDSLVRMDEALEELEAWLRGRGPAPQAEAAPEEGQGLVG